MDAESKARVKRYLDVAFRRKWWILAPIVISVAVTPLVFDQLPKKYMASTSILVSPKTLSERVAETTVQGVIQDRLASLAIQILSRSYLETVVEEMELVPPGASARQKESAAGRLKSNVELQYDTQNLSWFRVVAYDENAERSAAIANRLADLFIEQNRKWREAQASDNTEMVDQWLEEKKTELEEEERKIADYRKKHLFELPSQLNANLQQLEAAERRDDSLSQDIRSKMDLLQLLVAQAEARTGDPMSMPFREMDPVIKGYVDLLEELRQLRSRYTEENPAVRAKVTEIAEYEKAHPQVREHTDPEASPKLDEDIEKLKREIAALEEQREETRNQIDIYRKRVDRAPIHEQNLAALTRDYDILKKEYDDLLRKKGISRRGENLEETGRTEQFRVQDRARVPTVPYSPKFIVVLMLCAVTGMGAAAGMTVLLEFLDQTFRNEQEVREAFPNLPVLVAIPELEGGSKRKKPKRRKSDEAAASILLAITSALVAYGNAPWWTC